MIVELLVGLDVLTDCLQEDEVVEALDHLGVEVAAENLGGLACGHGAPKLGLGKEEYLLPVCDLRHDLEELWQLSTLVGAENTSEGLVSGNHLGVKGRGDSLFEFLILEVRLLRGATILELAGLELHHDKV